MEWKNKSEDLATLGKKNVLSTLLIKVLPQLSDVGIFLLVHPLHKNRTFNN